MAPDLYNVMYSVGGVVLGGGLVHFFKRYTEQSDAADKAIPKMAQAIESIGDAIVKINSSVKELYESRNQHNVDIAKINTLHEVLKCVDKVKKES